MRAQGQEQDQVVEQGLARPLHLLDQGAAGEGGLDVGLAAVRAEGLHLAAALHLVGDVDELALLGELVGDLEGLLVGEAHLLPDLHHFVIFEIDASHELRLPLQIEDAFEELYGFSLFEIWHGQSLVLLLLHEWVFCILWVQDDDLKQFCFVFEPAHKAEEILDEALLIEGHICKDQNAFLRL